MADSNHPHQTPRAVMPDIYLPSAPAIHGEATEARQARTHPNSPYLPSTPGLYGDGRATEKAANSPFGEPLRTRIERFFRHGTRPRRPTEPTALEIILGRTPHGELLLKDGFMVLGLEDVLQGPSDKDCPMALFAEIWRYLGHMPCLDWWTIGNYVDYFLRRAEAVPMHVLATVLCQFIMLWYPRWVDQVLCFFWFVDGLIETDEGHDCIAAAALGVRAMLKAEYGDFLGLW